MLRWVGEVLGIFLNINFYNIDVEIELVVLCYV